MDAAQALSAVDVQLNAAAAAVEGRQRRRSPADLPVAGLTEQRHRTIQPRRHARRRGPHHHRSQDTARALALVSSAASFGNATAQTHLCVMYDCGQGVSQDFVKASEIYTISADQVNQIGQAKVNEIFEALEAGRLGGDVNAS